jgi:hypothetical protein
MSTDARTFPEPLSAELPGEPAPVPAPNPEPPAWPGLYRLTVEQYEKMGEAGILPSGTRVELVEGLLVGKMTKNPPHTVAILLLTRWLGLSVPDGFLVGGEIPVALPGQRSEPEPDLVILRADLNHLEVRQPTAADVALVIEVSDSSYRYDRRVKARLYASGGVPRLWILDLNGRRLEVHTDPGPEGYGSVALLGEDEEVALVLDGAEAARAKVGAFLPRPAPAAEDRT